IPVGLLLANRWGWHAPFFLIVGVSTYVGVVIALRMRPIDGHLALKRPDNPFHHLFVTVSRGEYLRAFRFTMLLVTGGFLLMPFRSAYIVHNVGIRMDSLPIIYMVTGLVSIVGGPIVGRLSDSVGKYAVFCGGSAAAAVLVVVFTNLGPSPLWLITAVNVVLML